MARPGRRPVFLVTNAGDEAGTGAYLAALGGPDQHRAVVRPTPGERDVAVLGADVLVALGKNPQVLGAERIGAEAWNLARAWTIGLGVRDLVVDRVHLLTPEQIVALLDLAAGQATVWLIYGGIDHRDTAEHLEFLGHPVEHLPWPQLPTGLRPARAPQDQTTLPWPVLPAADFTTFLAACHRHLPRSEFERVATVYESAAQRADVWAGVHRGSGPTQLTAGLGRWLRDEQLPPTLAPAEALVTLRATQAALFVHGMLLRWNTAALGPEPAGRLPGDLTTGRTAALSAFARTDHTAAAALSLHLNLGPIGFGCWRCGDVSPDGATLEPPREHGPHPGQRPLDAELPCDGPISVPAHARPILAAHLAYRRGAAARDQHPLFVHPNDKTQPIHNGLRSGIQRINERINLNPTWMHRSPCRWGADVGLAPRSPGWLTERGLTMHLLDAPFHLQMPAAPRPRRAVR
jgi:hypothetical protein